MLYVGLVHRYSVLYVLRADAHTYTHMTCTRAAVRSYTRGQHLPSHRRVARVLAHLRRPYRRAV